MAKGKIISGAMIGGSLLPEKEFKEVLLELLQNTEFEKKMIQIIYKALRRYNAGSYSEFYDAIEEIETELFKNPPVSLMVITNLKTSDLDNNDYEWAWKSSEAKMLDRENQNMALKYSNLLKKEIIKKKTTEEISKHLQNMIKQVETQKMTNEDYNFLFKYKHFRISRDRKKDFGERVAKIQEGGKTMDYVFYGDVPDSQRRGKIADAFLSHLGNMHSSLFDFDNFSFFKMSSGFFTKSVYEEEGKTNFYQLLLDSGNNTGWWTGGDLILLNGNEIVANIQLKTIAKAKQTSVGTVKTDRIIQYIQQLRDFIDNTGIYNKQRFVEIWYDGFKTSGIMNQLEDKIEESSIDFVKRKLSNIPDITIS